MICFVERNGANWMCKFCIVIERITDRYKVFIKTFVVNVEEFNYIHLK